MKSCEKKAEKVENQKEWLQQLIPETKIEQKDIGKKTVVFLKFYFKIRLTEKHVFIGRTKILNRRRL